MFYFLSIVILFYNLLLYASFRSGIYDYLRSAKMSKSNIRKKRKGFKNYWLYQSIHKERPLGVLYGLNYLFFIVTVLYSVLALALGFLKAFQPFLFGLSILLCWIEIPSTVIASVHRCNEEFGKPFVWLAKRKALGGYHSSLTDMLSSSVTILLICLCFQQL